MYHVHSLTVENFKRLVAAKLTFPEGGGTVEVCGLNGSGKTSLIDSVWAAIGGKSASPDQPIRSGARKGSVVLDLGDIVVRREWDGSGTRLTVTDGEHGGKVSRPQELLDSLFSRLAFDPLEFTRKRPDEQARILREITGLDFAELDRRRAAAYEERTAVNRAIKADEVRLANLPDVAPVDEVSAADLSRELQEATRHNGGVVKARQAMEAKQREADAIADRVVRIDNAIEAKQAEIARIQKEIETLEQQSKDLAGQHEDAYNELQDLTAAIPAEIDTAPILEQIANAERTNRQARAYRERQAVAEQLDGNRRHAQRLTEAIEDIDTERQQMLASARFPVDGLSLDGETVTFGGVPLGQASSAEQIRVSLGIGAALNPKLRLLVVKDGSLLDDRSLAMVARWAAEHDYQVLVERVATSVAGESGVVIEEGVVSEAVSAA